MQPEDKESPVQVTVLTRDGEGEHPIGSGILVAPLVVLADQTLSTELYGRPSLFPTAQDDLAVFFARPADADADPDAAVDPAAPIATEPAASALQAPQSSQVPQPDSAAPVESPGRDPGATAFFVELVDGERTQRIEVCELYRSLDTPLPWVGFGLAEPTDMPLSEVPAEAKDGLFDPLERNRWVCLLMPKACR